MRGREPVLHKSSWQRLERTQKYVPSSDCFGPAPPHKLFNRPQSGTCQWGRKLHKVRAITEADIPGFWETLGAVARESSFLRSAEAPPFAAVQDFVLGNIEAGNPQFVALADGQVVGWCDIVRSTATHERHCGELGMGVRSDWRGRGLGRSLLEATLAEADARGVLRVELSVHSDNPRAIALYIRNGFIEEGRKLRARIKGNAVLDVLLMARLQPDEHWPLIGGA